MSVHPRVCGRREAHVRAKRFIPACAGNASQGRPRIGRRPVHPRVCGERHGGEAQGGVHAGSSPRVRGTRGRPSHRGRLWRFIPACAGNAPHKTVVWW